MDIKPERGGPHWDPVSKGKLESTETKLEPFLLLGHLEQAALMLVQDLEKLKEEIQCEAHHALSVACAVKVHKQISKSVHAWTASGLAPGLL